MQCHHYMQSDIVIVTNHRHKGYDISKGREKPDLHIIIYTWKMWHPPPPFNKKYVPPIKRNCAVAFDYSIQSAIILLKKKVDKTKQRLIAAQFGPWIF